MQLSVRARGVEFDMGLYKATPNKSLDSHPNFVKNWGWWGGFYFSIVRTAKNRTVLKETFDIMK